ncbi:MAG: arsenic efflux protein [Lachnospiraceae bacterium]|nr:arsenic efflux protein [Lachnospiraceae bacterium]
MWETILDALLDAVIDTAKLLPFLFLTYLGMEWLEHRTEEKTKSAVEKAGRLGPLFGGLLGVVPQCGFSAAAASLYAGRVITAGTLLAVFLSTSDEMLPILLSSGVGNWAVILKALAVKMVYGAIAGFGVDLLHRVLVERGILGRRKMIPASSDKSLLEEEPGTEHIKDLCEQENCHCDKGVKGIFVSAASHTLRIAAYIFVITLALNLLMELGGEELISGLFTTNPIIQALLAGVIGLIPNCAASVIITQLYLEGMIGAGALLAGLMVGAGTGLLVLFRTNRSALGNLKVVVTLYVLGVAGGLLAGLIPIW